LREEAQALFASGELTFADVLAASREETKARRGELTAEESLARACVDLEAAAGILSELDGVTGR